MAEPHRFLEAPPVTPQQVEQAREDKIHATKHGLIVSLAPAALTVVLGPLVPAAVATGVSFWSGIHFHRTPSGGLIPGISPAAGALYFAPIPLGVVPPEEFGLDPSMAPHTFGDFPGQKTIGFKANEVREAVFNAREREVLIIAEAKRTANYRAAGDVTTAKLVSDLEFLRATTHQEGSSPQVLKLLEAKVAERLAVEKAQPAAPQPVSPHAVAWPSVETIAPAVLPTPPPSFARIAIPNPLAAANRSFSPHAVKANTTLARASEAKADFTRKDHVTERADP